MTHKKIENIGNYLDPNRFLWSLEVFNEGLGTNKMHFLTINYNNFFAYKFFLFFYSENVSIRTIWLRTKTQLYVPLTFLLCINTIPAESHWSQNTVGSIQIHQNSITKYKSSVCSDWILMYLYARVPTVFWLQWLSAGVCTYTQKKV